LQACKRRRGWLRFGYAVMSLVALAGLRVFYHVSQSQYPPALAAKGLVVRLGLWSVQLPEMQNKIPIDHPFDMGDAKGDDDEKPVHTVKFAKKFAIGRHEVTFDEYDLFAAATGREKPGDEGRGRGNLPVINVSWKDAIDYTHWLSDRTGLEFRLPTEAEWEYAARAGTSTARYWKEGAAGTKDPACTYANVFDEKNKALITIRYPGITWSPFACDDNFPFTAPVGQFKPNDLGLYDVLGNVWEWTRDCYAESYENTPRDGTAQEADVSTDCPLRVLRGGSWDLGPRYVRSAYRGRNTPDDRLNNVGFRLARTL
jgi:formylglycine-generating enzyme required for sulfatase activity